jgi:hypothetical protein
MSVNETCFLPILGKYIRRMFENRVLVNVFRLSRGSVKVDEVHSTMRSAIREFVSQNVVTVSGMR